MSRAFVKESDRDGTEMPERAISEHPNFVTKNGLHEIESKVRSLEEARSEMRGEVHGGGDLSELARIERELRYWSQRKGTARVVTPSPIPAAVRFGVSVALRRHDNAKQELRLVGEDEADPNQGLISWVSPLAQAILGLKVGDRVEFGGQELEVLSLEA